MMVWARSAPLGVAQFAVEVLTWTPIKTKESIELTLVREMTRQVIIEADPLGELWKVQLDKREPSMPMMTKNEDTAPNRGFAAPMRRNHQGVTSV